jgi:hypothetical protein
MFASSKSDELVVPGPSQPYAILKRHDRTGCIDPKAGVDEIDSSRQCKAGRGRDTRVYFKRLCAPVFCANQLNVV